MEELSEKTNDQNSGKSLNGTGSAFKPIITIRRKQTRKIMAQVDEEIADLADEYVQFISECAGYQVTHGEILNEIYKSHFARDTGFKGWKSNKSDKQSGEA